MLFRSRDVPSGTSISWVNFSSQPLNDQTQQSVQESLTLDHTPLLAMRHLHRAKLEHMPHHKWIDATIAAELAIKEVLARAKPDLEPLLVNMQSPPFSKLYGDVLATYLGEESPFRKRLITGQEVRNALVHRPGAEQIDSQEANDYVEAVEGAIFHLLSLLYPKDPLIVEARYRADA